jgi:hypothetical protein
MAGVAAVKIFRYGAGQARLDLLTQGVANVHILAGNSQTHVGAHHHVPGFAQKCEGSLVKSTRARRNRIGVGWRRILSRVVLLRAAAPGSPVAGSLSSGRNDLRAK